MTAQPGANFNGSQYVDVPLEVNSAALTVSAWFNAANFMANSRIIANSHTDVDARGFQLEVNSGGASGFFDVGNGSIAGTASWSQQLATGAWHHYAGTYDGATVRAYIDGIQVASTPFAGGAIGLSGQNINIARNPGDSGDYFAGALSDVRIYGRALSASEILALYQAVSPPPPPPAPPPAPPAGAAAGTPRRRRRRSAASLLQSSLGRPGPKRMQSECRLQ
jgi:Concanavalin A-like lectin/glucanases superfamily